MKLAVFGATGGTGRNIVEQALAAGHEVQALVRNPTRLSAVAKQADIIVGDVLDPAKVAATLRGVAAVAVALGSRRDSPDNTVSAGTQNIITAMQAEGLKRLVVITSLGVGDSQAQVPRAFKLVMKTVMRKRMVAKERQEQFVRASGLDWIILRPGELQDTPATGNYTYGTDKNIMAQAISRADLAEFAIRQFTEGEFLGQAVAVT
jgi:putative NADH-flavin reductase